MNVKITVDYFEHEKTGLVVAVSDDIRGLFVAGRSVEEVESKLPSAVSELVQAEMQVAAKRHAVGKTPAQAGFRQMQHHRQIELTAA